MGVKIKNGGGILRFLVRILLGLRRYFGALHLGLVVFRVVSTNIGALHLVQQTGRISLTQSSRGIIFVETTPEKSGIGAAQIFNFQEISLLIYEISQWLIANNTFQFAKRFNSFIYHFLCYVEVGYKPNRLRAERSCLYAFFRQAVEKSCRCIWRFDVENDDIGLHRAHVIDIGQFLKRPSQPAGPFVVFPEAFHVVVQSIDACRRQVACLPHSAAHDFTHAPRLPDKRLPADEQRTYRAPSPFDRQMEMLSNNSPTSLVASPVSTSALNIRAPSR
jgi:hypothetical protein